MDEIIIPDTQYRVRPVRPVDYDFNSEFELVYINKKHDIKCLEIPNPGIEYAMKIMAFASSTFIKNHFAEFNKFDKNKNILSLVVELSTKSIGSIVLKYATLSPISLKYDINRQILWHKEQIELLEYKLKQEKHEQI